MRYAWVAFGDGARRLGVAILAVDVELCDGNLDVVAAAVRKAWAAGLNPGGDAVVYELSARDWGAIPAEMRERLLDPAEVRALQELLGALVELDRTENGGGGPWRH